MQSVPEYVDLREKALEILWDNEVPAGAAACFDKQVRSIANFVLSEKQVPNKSDLRNSMSDIEQSAKTLRRLLTPINMHYLLHAKSDHLTGLAECLPLLDAISVAATKVIDRTPSKKGHGVVLPRPGDDLETSLSGRDYAALVAAGFWRRAKGNWPGVAGSRVDEVIEFFWEAAGGAAKDGRGWREQLKRVRPYHDMILAEIDGQINIMALFQA